MGDKLKDRFQNTHETGILGCSAVSAEFSSEVGYTTGGHWVESEGLREHRHSTRCSSKPRIGSLTG